MQKSKAIYWFLGIFGVLATFVGGYELGRSMWMHDLNDVAMGDQVFVQAALAFKDIQRLEAGATDELRDSLNDRLDSRLTMLTSVANGERIKESCFLARLAEFRAEHPRAGQYDHISALLSSALPVDEACQPCDDA